MFRTLIVDDESSARQNIKSLLEFYRPGDLIIEAQNADEALQMIGQYSPQLMFLDIEMPGETGIELLQKIHKVQLKINVIFITAYSHFAIQAIKCEAFDYILKPIDENEFKKTITRLEQKQPEPESETGKNFEKLLQHFQGATLKIKTKRGVDLVEFDDIVYLEAKSNYTEIIIQDRSPQLISQTLGKLESQLNSCNFLRVGRSHIINKKHVIGTDHIKKIVKIIHNNIPQEIQIPIKHLRTLERDL